MTVRGGTLFRASGASLVLTGVFALLPALLGTDTYRLSELESIGALILVAVGLNVVTGFAGQLTLGPSAVFAIGAYAAIVFANDEPRDASLVLVCLISVGAAAVAGMVIGLPALRIGGFYLALVTLFVAAAVPTIADVWSVTGAGTGISLASNLDFIQSVSGLAFYEITVIVVGVVLVASAVLRQSRLGRRMFVLKSSEELAASLGCSTYRLKTVAFLLSAIAAGLGGGIYVYSQQYMGPGSADVNTSIYLLAACVIAGLGTSVGPAIGVAFVYGLQDFLGLQQYSDVVFGGLLVIVAVTLPEGLLGSGKELWIRLRDRNGPQSASFSIVPSTVPAAELRALLGDGADPSATLSAVNLRRTFGGVAAVDDVSLSVCAGRVHGLIGSNGSGKTTLLNLISGFYRPNAGRVEVGGSPLRLGHPSLGVKAGLARTFQTPKLVDHETVFNNVRSIKRVKDDSSTEMANVSLALRLVGLEALADVQVRKVPHGTRRLVEIARAVALKPQFMLLDEPAAGLASGELDVLRHAIRTLADAGVGILLVEHNVPLVAALANEVTVMHLGKVLAHGEPQDVLHDESVARAFLGASASGVESGS